MNPVVKRILYGVVAVGVLVALAWPKLPRGGDAAAQPGAGGGPSALQVQAHVVEPQTLRDRLLVTGSLRADEAVALRSEVSGRVTGLYFDEGRPVRQGALLVKINDRELQAQLRQAEYRVTLAEDREQRQQALLDKGGISREEYDATLNELNVLRAQIDLIEAQIEKTEVRAPFDGVVGLRQISVGSYIGPTTDIATLQALQSVKVEFSVPERHAGRVEVGDDILFRVEGSDEQFRGRIYAAEPRIEADTRTLVVRARTPNPDGRLRPGAFADIELIFDEIEDGLTVPAIAVIPELGGKKVFVYQGGQAVPRTVETGLRLDDRVQILDGLAAQDTVLVSGIQQLRPGLPVEVAGL